MPLHGGSWGGLALIPGGLVTYLLGMLARLLRGRRRDDRHPGGSGLVPAGGDRPASTGVPVLFLLFMVPLPFVEPMSVPLARFTGGLAAQMVRLLGVPITVDGAQVTLPNANLVVGAQCSGLRSIVALLTLVALFVFVVEGPSWGKGLLALSAIPIAILGNIVRGVSSLLGVSNAWKRRRGFTTTTIIRGSSSSSGRSFCSFCEPVGRCNEIRRDIFS
jgi:exosortase/archaeosortase family protein